MKHIVIIGAGFTGVRLSRKLQNNKNIHITLINDSPDFRYYPALYRVAVGFKMGIARLPLEWMLLDHPRLTLLIDTAQSVDKNAKTVTLASGAVIAYDKLVCALGSVTTFFNIEGLHEHAFGIKSASEIFELRKHLHDTLIKNGEIDKNYVIIGGGPTGVELAASFGSYIKKISKVHHTKSRRAKVWLVEAAPRVLPTMSEAASTKAAKHLKKLRVKILVNTKVTKETIKSLDTSEGKIETHTVIWTAGTMNSPFFAANNSIFPLNERGRVLVNKHLQVDPDIYVAGDNAAVQYGGLALTAVRHADYLAEDISRTLSKHKRKVFKPKIPEVVLPVGNNYAIFQYGKITFGGRFGHWLRRAADIIGYSDVMGFSKAYSIWKNGDTPEEWCNTCAKKNAS